MDQPSSLRGSNEQIKVNFKVIVLLLLFLVAIYYFIPRLVDFQQALKLILKVNKFYLLIAVGFEFLSYVGAAWLLGVILTRMGYKIPFWDRFKIGSMGSFAIHFFPVGSFGQGAVDFYYLRKRKVEPGSILIMIILRVMITYTAFFLMFFAALALVPTASEITLLPKLISLILLFFVILGVMYMIYLYQNKEKFRRFWHKFLIPINFLFRAIKREHITEAKADEIFEDVYQGMHLFSQKKRSTILAILAGLVYWFGDILCFFFVFLSFGYLVHMGVLMFSYGVGSLVGMISFIPGGLGVTEGSLGFILTALGVPSAIALMSILVFRFFSFWIWIPVGLYSFLSLRKKKTN